MTEQQATDQGDLLISTFEAAQKSPISDNVQQNDSLYAWASGDSDLLGQWISVAPKETQQQATLQYKKDHPEYESSCWQLEDFPSPSEHLEREYTVAKKELELKTTGADLTQKVDMVCCGTGEIFKPSFILVRVPTEVKNPKITITYEHTGNTAPETKKTHVVNWQQSSTGHYKLVMLPLQSLWPLGHDDFLTSLLKFKHFSNTSEFNAYMQAMPLGDVVGDWEESGDDSTSQEEETNDQHMDRDPAPGASSFTMDIQPQHAGAGDGTGLGSHQGSEWTEESTTTRGVDNGAGDVIYPEEPVKNPSFFTEDFPDPSTDANGNNTMSNTHSSHDHETESTPNAILPPQRDASFEDTPTESSSSSRESDTSSQYQESKEKIQPVLPTKADANVMKSRCLKQLDHFLQVLKTCRVKIQLEGRVQPDVVALEPMLIECAGVKIVKKK